MIKYCCISLEEAYTLLLFSILGYDMACDKEVYNYYFKEMVSYLDIKKYQNNQYYKNVNIKNINKDNIKYEEKKYNKYELFVYNDLIKKSDGRIIPQLGFFSKEYSYPCVKENNREWMLITPNEIETMSKVIEDSTGDVLTYGLGLGYFPYMVSLKKEVNSVTIVEKDKKVIFLFEKYILPQFKYKNKIKIINADAFEYQQNNKTKYDLTFIDIWHDPSDEVDLYLKFKSLEKDNSVYRYWIEDTIKCYL
jgi:hypothetical protein